MLLGAAHAEGEAAWTTESWQNQPCICMTTMNCYKMDTCLKSDLKAEKVLIPDLICISKDAGYLFSIVFIVQKIRVQSHYLNS